MRITLELPEDIAARLGAQWTDLPRAVLESLAIEAYRSGVLAADQVGRLLGLETRPEIDAFLKRHRVFDYSVQDLDDDRRVLSQLRGR